MYDAYAKIVVVKNKQDVTSLVADSRTNTIYTGLRNGSLVCFDEPKEHIKEYGCRVFRQFEKKSVVDLQIIEELNLIICLSGGQVIAHSINNNFDVFATIDKYPLITAFHAHVREKDNKLFIAISAKRQLHIFKLIHKTFEEIDIQFDPPTLLDNLMIIRWCSSYSLYFANKNEYSYVQIFKDDETGENNIGKINSFANRQDGSMVVIKDKKWIGICRSTIIEFYTCNGNKIHNCNIKYEEQPITLAYDSPYLIAGLSNNIIDIRSLTPNMVIQKIPLIKPMFLSVGPSGIVNAVGSELIIALTSKPLIKDNIYKLLEDKQFDLASNLADVCNKLTKEERTKIKRETAAAFFAQQRFKECFDIHKKEKTDVLLLLHFMPDLIPEKFRTKAGIYTNEAHDFLPCPDFAPNHRKIAEKELSDYLSEVRTEYAMMLEKHRQKQITLSTSELKQRECILELADTVLLKCYLRTKQSMVPSLLRLPHNQVNVDEAAKDLRDSNRFDDLYLLYSKKNMRKKALDVLKIQSQKEESMYYGLDEIVSYLQTFGPSNFELLKEYSKFVLEKQPEFGVKIFANNDNDNAKDLNRELVLIFLQKECEIAVIPYLEHIIYQWNENRQLFHEKLIFIYIVKVKELLDDYVHAMRDDEGLPKAGEEDGELGEYRKKLLNLLNDSKSYNPATIEEKLNDKMMHEKAIILGRLNRHEEALLIYANILMDYEMAEKHCIKYFDEKSNENIFVTLFKAYTNPSLLSSYNVLQERIKYSHSKVKEALKLLTKHPTQLDPVEALQLLPSKTPLHQVWPALEAVLEALKNKATSIEIHQAVSELALQKSELNLKRLKSERFIVDDNVKCCMCDKLVDSAFIRWKDGKIAHHSCYTKCDLQNNQKLSRSRTISLM